MQASSEPNSGNHIVNDKGVHCEVESERNWQLKIWGQPFKIRIDDLYKCAQSALNEARNFKAKMHPDLMIESLFKVWTSAGGRRPKAIINFNPETNECYSGQMVNPMLGYVSMIIKFDEHSDIPTIRIEYCYYLMAKDMGLNMMSLRFAEGEKTAYFPTERFDCQ